MDEKGPRASILFKLDEAPIGDGDPWHDDFLDRRPLANQLASVVSTIRQPFTIAVSGDYGSGKSFFLRRLNKDLRSSYKTAFFDAWQSDYADDALASFIAVIQRDVAVTASKEVRARFDSLVSAAAPIIAKAVVKRALGDDEGKALLSIIGLDAEEAGKKIEAVFDERLKAQQKAAKAVEGFKRRLRDLALEGSDQADGPGLIVFVDELDRCRPAFAISVLETLKHFFDVPGVVFILGVSEKPLKGAIAAAGYGASDHDGYLRRFIDLRLRLPDPPKEKFVISLVRRASLVEDGILTAGQNVENGAVDFVKSFGLMASALGTPLRKQAQVFTECDLALRSMVGRSRDALMLPVIAFARHYKEELCREYSQGGGRPEVFAKWVQDLVGQNDDFSQHLPAFVLAWGMSAGDENWNGLAERSDLGSEVVDSARDVWQSMRSAHRRSCAAKRIFERLEFWEGVR